MNTENSLKHSGDGLGRILKKNIRNYSMFLVLVGITLIFAWLTGFINLSPRNITNIVIQNSYILVLAVGMILVIVTGNIDLSVGSVCAFTGAISAMLYNTGIGLGLTLLISVILGAAIGAFQGFWIAFMKVPAFIVTLSGMMLFRGLTYIITKVAPVPLVDDRYKKIASGYLPDIGQIGNYDILSVLIGIAVVVLFVAMQVRTRRKNQSHRFDVLPFPFFVIQTVVASLLIVFIIRAFALYRGIPVVAVLLTAVVAVFAFMTRQTVFGRHIYAVGGNARAAKLSGINSEQIVFLVFVMMGALAALSGMIFTGYLNSALPQSGNLFELEAIASSFIGGASASGGIGTIVGAIIGGLVMGIINNGMSLMNLGAEYQLVVKAAVLLLAVWYDVYTRRKSS